VVIILLNFQFSRLPLCAGGQKNERKKETKNQKLDMVRRVHKWLRIHEASPVRRKGLWWEGFVNKVGFEPGMKERGNYG